MKKRNLLLTALCILTVAVCALGLVACKSIEVEVHEHEYSTEWSHDDNNHYHACTYPDCKVVVDGTAHSFGEWTVVTPATVDAKGKDKRECSVCDYVQYRDTDKLIPSTEHAHVWSSWMVLDSNKPDNTRGGKATRTCSGSGACDAATADKEYPLPALSVGDYKKVSDTATCAYDGFATYTYSVKGETVSFSVASPLDENAHNYGGYTYADGNGHYKVCEYDSEHKTSPEPHETDGNGNKCHVCGYLPTDMLTPTDRSVTVRVGGNKSATIYGYTVSNTYHTYTYTGEKPITVAYRYYVLGDKDEFGNDVERTGNVTLSCNGQRSFTVYLQTHATCTMNISSDEADVFEAEIKLTRVGSEDPNVEHVFTFDTLASVDTNFDGKKYSFTAQDEKWYVLTCNNVNARVMLMNDSGDDEAIALPYEFHLGAGEKIVFLMCTVDADATYGAKIGNISADVCDHDYSSVTVPATCTVRSHKLYTCDKCGDEYTGDYTGDLKQHGYEWETVTPATCTAEGEKKGICSVCKKVTYETIAMIDHDTEGVEWTVVKPATCSAEGSKTLTCKVCHQVAETEVIPIDPDAHNYGSAYVKNDPDGHYKVCTHNSNHTTEKVAHDMLGTGGACSVCGYVWPNMITPTKTQYAVNVGGDNAARTVYGYAPSAAYYTYSYKGETPITVSYTYKVDGTDTTKTVTLSKNSRRSFTVYLAAKGVCTMSVTSAAEIAFDATIMLTYNGATDPTAAKTFTLDVAANVKTTYDGVKYTFTADEEYWYILTFSGANARVLLINGASTQAVTSPYMFYLEADETAEFMMCTVDADATYTAKVVQNTTELCVHDYSEQSVPATCTEKAHVLYTCNRCGDEYTDGHTGDLEPHSYEWETVTPATCTAEGEKEGTCTVCGHVTQETVAMVDHDTEGVDWTVVKAATCSAEGSKKLICKACGEVAETAVIDIDPDAHSYGSAYVKNDPDGHYKVCTHNSSHTTEKVAHDMLGTGGACSVCGYVWPNMITPTKTQYAVNVGGDNAAGVVYGYAPSAAYYTYSYKGETPITVSYTYKVGGTDMTKTVTLAKDVRRSFTVQLAAKGVCTMSVTSAAETAFDATIMLTYNGATDPTAAKAFTLNTSATIDTTYDGVKYTFTAAEEHWYTLTCRNDNARVLLINSDGTTTAVTLPYEFLLGASETIAFMMCTVDEDATYSAKIAKNTPDQCTHEYTDHDIPATCTVRAHVLHVCDKCGDEYRDGYTGVLEPHSYEWETLTAATCTAEGEKEGACSVCGHVTQETVAMIDHDTEGVEWVIVTAATCSAEGSKTLTCKVCHQVAETEVIPIDPDAHNYGSTYVKTIDGHYKVCTHNSNHTTEKVAHDMNGTGGACSVCGYVWPNMIVPTTKPQYTFAVGGGNSAIVYGYAPSAAYYTYSYKGENPITVSYTYKVDGTDTTKTVTLSKNSRRSFTVYLAAKGVCTMSVTSAAETAFDATVMLTYNGATDPNATKTFTLNTAASVKTTYDGVKYTFTAATEYWYVLTSSGATARVLLINSDGTTTAVTLPYEFHLGASETVAFMMCTVDEDATYNAKIAKITPTTCTHSYTDKSVTATCTEQAHVLHTCVKCGNEYKDGFTGDLAPHSYEWETVTPATCTAEGEKKGTCSECDKVVHETIAMIPHDTDGVEWKIVTAATCSAEGSKTLTCKVCHQVAETEVIPIDPDAHNYGSAYVKTDSDGHYKVCTLDNSHTTEKVAHDMLGTGGACSVCGYVWPNMITPTKTQYAVNVGGGASAGVVYGYAPSAAYYTYTYKGETPITVSYTYKVDGADTTKTVTLSKNSRRSFTVYLAAKGVCTMSVTSSATTAFAATIKLTYNDSVDPNLEQTFTLNTSATINTTYDGVKYTFTAATENWYVLTNSGENARVLLINGAATQGVTLPYAFSLDESEEIAFMMCAVDDDATYSAMIAKLNATQCQSIFGSHNYSHVVTDPTCSAQGYTTHTCDRCGYNYTDSNTDKLDHEYNWNITVEPTCTRPGKRSGVCKNCGDTVIDQEIPMKAHTTQGAVWQVVSEANCDVKGSEKLCCTVCHNIVQTRDIPVIPDAHSYVVTVIKKPTYAAGGSAQLVCIHNEAHTSTAVTLPKLTSSDYIVSENDQFRTYKIQTDIGEVTFSVELEEINTIDKAIEYAVNTSDMLVESTIDMALDAVQGGGGGTITYEFGDNYIHATDGYMNTERWITLKNDGTFFALIEKEDRNNQIHIMDDTSACLDDFKGYAFLMAYAQQEWEMPAIYGTAQYVDVLYRFASQNANSKNFSQSIITKYGKDYYTFSYAFVDADPHDNNDMNHSISVEFTLNDDYFMDYCKIIGQTNRGKTIGSGEQLATQTYTVSQYSRRGIGQQAPVNPYDEDTIALTDYRLRYILSADESLENIVLGDGYFPIDGANNSLGTIGYEKTYQLQLVEYTPTEGVNLRYDVIRFYLRKHGESGLGELLDGSYDDIEGHVLASYDPISRVVSLGFYRAGEYDLILKTVKTEKVVHFNIPIQDPDKIDAYVYNDNAGADESQWQSDKTEFGIVTGYSLTFYGRVSHPGYQYSDYTVTVKKDGTVVNGVLTTTETDGKEVYVFTPNGVGSYTITLNTTHGNRTKTLSVQVLDVPDTAYLNGRFANDFKQISVDFDSSQNRFTLSVGSATAVYSYTLSGTTVNTTLVSGTLTEFDLYFNSAKELTFEKDGEKAILFKDGEANALIGDWSVPITFKVNVTGEYIFSFSKYVKSGESIIGCSIDGEDHFAVTQPLTIGLKSGQTISFATLEKDITLTVEMSVPITGITLDKTEETLFINDAVSLVATIRPSDASNTLKTWTSSDESVATVTVSGYVVAKGVGTAIITVTAADGVHSATCTITVLSRAVTGVSLNETTHTLYVDDAAFSLTATIAPDYAENKNVTWSSSNPAAATVDANGVVTPVGEGTTTITVTTVDGGKTATCVVTVNRRAVTGVSLDVTSHTLIVGGTLTLTATVAPTNATNKNVTWSTSDSSVATVVNGVVTAVGEGKATITVTTVDGGKTATCVVTVNRIAVTGVSLDVTSHQMYMNDTLTLTATVAPTDATYKTVTWTSSNEAVVQVEDGVVTPVGAGVAIITVTTTDGSKTATCEVTVLGVELTDVSIAPTTLSLFVNQTANITATLTPANASYISKSWTSSAPSVVTVDNNGKVTAVSAGTATITFKVVTATATFTKDCAVTVSNVAVTGVTLDVTSHTLNKGGTFTLTATVAPETATNKNVTWSTSDSSVATVVNGVVTAVGNGTADITVTTADGGFTAVCTVTVTVPVTGVTLDVTSHTMNKGGTLTLTATVAPSDATDKNVTWSTSDSGVATVVNGVVTAVGKGTATITVTTADGGFTATCAVTVTVPITGITLNMTEKEITVGEAFTLVAAIDPSDANYDSIGWTSSAPSVAVVDNNGKVTAVSKGEATITCTVVGVGGTFTAECDVTAILAHYGAGEHALSYATVTSTTFVLDGEVGAPYTITVFYSNYSTYIYNYFYVDGEKKGSSYSESFNLVLNNTNTEITVQKSTSGLTDIALKLVICKTRIAVGEALYFGAVGMSDMTIKLSGCVAGKEYKVTALQDGKECNSLNIVIEALGSYYNYGSATFTYANGVELKVKSVASSGLGGITLTLQEVVHVVVDHTNEHQLNYTPNGADKHTVICSVAGCNYEVHDEDHVYDDDSDDTCNLCGYKRIIPVDHTSEHPLAYNANNAYDHTVSCSVDGCTYDVHTETHVYDDDSDDTCDLCGYTREIAGGTVTLAVGGQMTIASLDWSGVAVELSDCVVGKEYKVTALQKGAICNDVSIAVPAAGIYFGFYGEVTFTYVNGASVNVSAGNTLSNVTVMLQEIVHVVIEHTADHTLIYTPNGANKHVVSCAVDGCSYGYHEEDHVYDGDDDDTCNDCGHKRAIGGNPDIPAGRTLEVNAPAPGTWGINKVSVGDLKAGEEVTIVIKCSVSVTCRIYWNTGNGEDERIDISAFGVETGNVIFVSSSGSDMVVIVKSNSGDLSNVVISVEEW